MIINGKGVLEYRTALEQGRIKPNDNLYVQNRSLEHYIVKKNVEKLDWGNIFDKTTAKTKTTSQILSRKNWYVKIR